MAGYRSVKSTIVPNTGTSYINGKPQGTVFGADIVATQEKASISGKWDIGVNLVGSDAVITSTGYVKVKDDESLLVFGAGTASDGAIMYSSLRRIRYEPGTPIYAKFTTAFPELSESNGDYIVGLGLIEGFEAGDNGISIYQRRVDNSLEYGIVVMRNGLTNYFPYNGELPPNPENLNIYRIEWGYLGIAPFNIYWRDTENEKWVRFHRQVFSQKVTSVTKPDLPVGAFAINQGNTTDIKITNGSFEAGTIGSGETADTGARKKKKKKTFVGTSGTDNLIFAFRNPEDVTMYDGIDISGTPTTRVFRNSIASQLLEVGLGVLDNNKIVDIEVVIVNSEDLGAATWTPAELGYSVLEISEDVAPIAGRTIEIFTRGKDESDEKHILTLDLLLPGQTALFVYTTASVDFDFASFIKFQDLF